VAEIKEAIARLSAEEWRSLHVGELRDAWQRSREQMPLESIEPLE
jgi:hypothetical protein